jgi:hypothetical protein
MGYSATINTSSLVIPRDNLQQVYHIWCNINSPKYDYLKQGQTYDSNNVMRKHYLWMDIDYHKNVDCVFDIIDLLQFVYRINAINNVCIDYFYGDKVGQEYLFICAIAHLLPDGKIVWVGEDAHIFEWEIRNGVMLGYYNPNNNCLYYYKWF